MKKIHVIGALLAIFSLTMAGCVGGGASGLFDKQVAFYKERNIRLKNEVESKAANEQISNLANDATKKEFIKLIDEKCDTKEIERLNKHFECATEFVKKKLDKVPYTAAGLDAMCKPLTKEKVRPDCQQASDKLLEKFKGHLFDK